MLSLEQGMLAYQHRCNNKCEEDQEPTSYEFLAVRGDILMPKYQAGNIPGGPKVTIQYLAFIDL